jgi:transcription initiation factor IIE alpha subunit
LTPRSFLTILPAANTPFQGCARIRCLEQSKMGNDSFTCDECGEGFSENQAWAYDCECPFCRGKLRERK